MKRIIIGSGGGGKGGGGGGVARAPIESPNSLRSKQYANIVDLLSEGEIAGLVDGPKSVFLDGTPLQNADNTFNFNSVIIDGRNGTQWQPYIDGFASVEDENAVNTEVTLAAPLVRTITDSDVDAVRVTVSTPRLSFQDPVTGDLLGASLTLLIDIQSNGAGYQAFIAENISGKTMSRYQRSYEIVLQGGPPWDVRVSRADQENAASNLQNQLFFDSYTEIIYSKLAYPNSALLALSIDASQFNSIPVRSFDIKGILVRVPSNYNPITRAYSGVWDGLFQIAWTDNPAWVFYDLVVESRYGLGAFISEEQVDKWGLYEIAQYCDELVPDGFGGQEPRFTCNLYLQTDVQALEALANLASIFRGMAYWSGGMLVGVQDAPSDPVFIYTNANVLGGSFEREGTSRDARHTVAIVMWNDPANEGRLVPEYVEDVAGISRYGIRDVKLTAFGCNSRGQAHRIGKWILYSERSETQTVRFSVGLEGLYCSPGNVIQTMDQHRSGARHGGRVVSATTTSITIDAAVTIGSGAHSVAVLMPDGSLAERPLTNAPGATSSLTWSSALDATPLTGAIWVLTTPVLSPEWWRVVSVAEADKVRYDIVAIEHDPNKFAAVEQDIILEPLATTVIQRVPSPPRNLELSSYFRTTTGGEVVSYITAAWDEPSVVFGEVRYTVEWRSENGNWQSRDLWVRTYDIEGVKDGELYEVSVTAINGLGYRSVPITSAIVATGVLRDDDAPDFCGGLTNMGRHYTGKLFPLSTATAADADWEIFDQHVYSPVTSASYELLEFDKGIDSVSKLYVQHNQAAGPGEGTPPTPTSQVDYRTEAGSYDGFDPWTFGSCNFRRAKGKLTWNLTPGNTMYVDSAMIIGDDIQSKQEEQTSVFVPSTGLVVEFSSDYNIAPNVTVTVIDGAGAVSARLLTKTTEDMTIVVLNAAGTQVDGTVDWSATGV